VGSRVKQNTVYTSSFTFHVLRAKGEDCAGQGNIRYILYEHREVPIERIRLSLTTVRDNSLDICNLSLK
jgi:hypothetical protein